MKDLHSNIGVAQCVAPSVLTDTTAGAAVSVKGFGSACVMIQTGVATGAGAFTATVEECDTGAAADFRPVVAGDLIGGNPPTPLAEGAVYKIGYIGTKQHIRAKLEKTGGTGLAVSAVVVLGHPALSPVA